uniref:Amino acid transporter transmembrane domain-containing protein n=1 Tax=Chromera velia CCMP2878 TaxID=1169474 RepID=A0A0G4G4V3_9ALVE|eukprot:Cvel_20260.t1-p1 / transcript=Cvel_20260.t1 / gene=Cvel_20260 / organism=Chromera_velia_CCMP2878 / gene_product=Sodium-coupled neutral amino acid transporter 5, putative / transcript_product=Sodium-coupled neutral amino acid transporter 5, putative / location=Cvel_scaffold1807:20608-27317(+) / protein_length=575 / sequence_SO=supercontig / SO=protein_coding / is_pseudo=false
MSRSTLDFFGREGEAYDEGLLNVMSLDLLIACARRTGTNSYEEIAECAFGSFARLITVIVSITLLFLVVTAYILTVSDIVSPLMLAWLPEETLDSIGGAFWMERGIKLITILLVSPLTYCRNLSALRHVSYVVFTMAALVTTAVIVNVVPILGKEHTTYVTNDESEVKPVRVGPDFAGIRLWPAAVTGMADVAFVLPALILSMMSHPNALPLHSELAQPTRRRIRLIILATVCLCVVLYSVIGTFGYLWASSAICGSLVLNFPPENKFMMIGRLGLGFACMLKIPLLLLPLRISCWKLVELVQSARKGYWVGCSGVPLEELGPSPPPSPPAELAEAADRQQIVTPTNVVLLQSTPTQGGGGNLEAGGGGSPLGKGEGESPAGGIGMAQAARDLLVPREGGGAGGGPRSRGRDASVFMSIRSGDGAGVGDMSFVSVDRHSLLYDVATGWDVPTPGHQVNEMPSTVLIVLTSLLLVALAVMVLSVSSIVSVWALAGSSCGISFAFIMPPSYFLRIRRQTPWNARKPAWSRTRYMGTCLQIGALLMLVGAIPMGVLAVHQALLHLRDSTCPAIEEVTR